MSYDSLFQPLRIGSMEIPNRFCVGPLTLPSLHDAFGAFSEDGLAYFEARARGGFGLIFTGAFHPDVLVDPVHPYDSKQPLKAPKSFMRSSARSMPTRRISSSTRSRTAARESPGAWTRTASAIWPPIVIVGLSEVMGS